MSVEIYREGESIYIPEATVGSWPVGALQAVGDGLGAVSVVNKGKADPDGANFLEVAGVAFGDIVDDTGATYGGDEATVVNALNALFSESALAAPTITSSTSVAVSTNTPINYEVTGTDIVGVEYTGLPSGLLAGNSKRRILTGEITSPGSYPVTVSASNAIGVTSTTVTFTATSNFADTKSVQFDNNDFMQIALAGGSMFARTGNGSGSSDAWSLSFWIKPATGSGNNTQTVLYFGGSDTNNTSGVWVLYQGGGGRRNIVLQYGSNNNNLRLTTAANSVPRGSWAHILVTYDGGTTGSSSGAISSYYSRFSIFVNGSAATTTNTHSNFGTTQEILSNVFNLARRVTGQSLRAGGKLNEVAVWDSDQSANISDIYNGGVVVDLSTLTTPPDGWWRMGDGDTFPTIEDNIGSSDGTLFNMTASDIVSDVP